MKKSAVLSVLILGLAAALAAVPAFAISAVPLYDNTVPVNTGTINGYDIANGWEITDSFTLSGNSTVTGANFVAWLDPGDTLSSVDWLITTDAFGGTTEGFGTTSTTYSHIGTADGYYNLDEESFSISGLPLGAGTYWLQLQNGVASNGHPIFWDASDGVSLAYQTRSADPSIPSETFQILGTGTAGPVVPEPSSFLLLGSGLAGLAGLLKRKLRA